MDIFPCLVPCVLSVCAVLLLAALVVFLKRNCSKCCPAAISERVRLEMQERNLYFVASGEPGDPMALGEGEFKRTQAYLKDSGFI